MNLVVDAVWNGVMAPILPTTADFSLPSNLQSLLYNITDPSLATDWENSMNTFISPLTSGLPSVSLNVPGAQSAFSTLGNDMGPFELINQIGGMQSVNWAINALINRTTTHLASWLAMAPSNDSAMNSFASNNDNFLSTNQVLDFYNAGSTYQSSMDKYLSGAVDSGQNFLDLPQIDITNIIDGLIGSLASELGSVEASVRAMIPVLDESPIGIAVEITVVIDEIFATLLTTSYLMFTPPTWNDLNPLTIVSFAIQSNQILFNPQSSQEQKLQAVAWIQASKLTSNILTLIGSEYDNNIYYQLALAASQTVNGLLGFNFALQLNNLYGYSQSDFLSAPLGVPLNIIELCLDLGSTAIDLLAASLNLKDTHYFNSFTSYSNNQLSSMINIGILGFIDIILIFDFVSKTNSSLTERTIFWTKFLGDIFKGVVYCFEAGTADESPPNEAEGIAEAVSGGLMVISSILQYYAMIYEPS